MASVMMSITLLYSPKNKAQRTVSKHIVPLIYLNFSDDKLPPLIIKEEKHL